MRTLMLLLLVLPALALGSGPVPLDLKGLTPGMSFADFDAKLPALCEKPVKSSETCGYGLTANVPLLETLAEQTPESWLFLFRDGSLSSVAVLFPGKSFRAIADALVAKFGKPSKSETSEVSNRMGAKFVQIEMSWYRYDRVLQISKIGRNVDSGVLFLTSKEYLLRDNVDGMGDTLRRRSDL